MTELQLSFDGKPIPLSALRARRVPLSAGQEDIIRVLRMTGSIRSAEAGRITYVHRPDPVSYERAARYAGSDGWAALKRLEQRGLVRHVRRGLWELTS